MTIPGLKLKVVSGGLRVMRDPTAEPSWEYLPTTKDHVLRSGDFRAVLRLNERPNDPELNSTWSITVFEKFEIVSRIQVDSMKNSLSPDLMKNISRSLLMATVASVP
jgi:hypothetical protein